MEHNQSENQLSECDFQIKMGLCVLMLTFFCLHTHLSAAEGTCGEKWSLCATSNTSIPFIHVSPCGNCCVYNKSVMVAAATYFSENTVWRIAL